MTYSKHHLVIHKKSFIGSRRRPLFLNILRPLLLLTLITIIFLKQHLNLFPSFNHLVTHYYHDEPFISPEYRALATRRLCRAVQIPTVIYDDMGELGEDDRWDVFYTMAQYLESEFPKIYENLDVRVVNEHGLLYIWPGSDESLKPLLFMTHQDVVPVPNSTLHKWTYPPFSGHYDGTYIWGRGAEDDKSNLIAKLSAVEALLDDFPAPKRTVVIAVGFDEEGGNEKYPYGAKGLSEEIERVFGRDSMEMILDEGTGTIEPQFGTNFAMLGTAEKGYLDIQISVETPGGHSSAPPDFTAIDYLAKIITSVNENQFHSQLTDRNPVMKYLALAARYGKDMPDELRDAIFDPEKFGVVLGYLEADVEMRALVRTSIAVDVVRGGEKANQLPETAEVLINHRIAVESSVQAVKDHYIDLLQPLASSWNFSLCAFGENVYSASPEYTIRLNAKSPLEPSPVTDTETKTFTYLEDTIHHVFGESVVASPFLEIGNTDTKYYWNLSNQIYRFNPWRRQLDPAGSRIHTVNERMPVDGLLQMITFYYHLIKQIDEEIRIS